MMDEPDSEYVADEIATEPERLGPSDDDWWRELQTEIDAESTSNTTTGLGEAEICWRATGLREAEICWRAADKQFAFARNLSTLPAESNGGTPDLRRLME
jgi:hypothetical protein